MLWFRRDFAVSEEAVSCLMGEDRVLDHEQAGAEVLAANDMSCLMHLDGIIRRQKSRSACCMWRRFSRARQQEEVLN